MQQKSVDVVRPCNVAEQEVIRMKAENVEFKTVNLCLRCVSVTAPQKEYMLDEHIQSTKAASEQKLQRIFPSPNNTAIRQSRMFRYPPYITGKDCLYLPKPSQTLTMFHNGSAENKPSKNQK